MKKLKRKNNNCAKNARITKEKMAAPDFKVLSLLAFIQRVLSIYKLAKDLGWIDSLPALMEKIGAVMKAFYSTFLKHL